MRKDESIDYLQWSVPEIPDFLGIDYLQAGSPIVFYKACNEYRCGSRVMYGNRNSDNFLIQMGGKACDYHDMTKNTGRLEYALSRGGKFSRVDLAITVDASEPLSRFRKALASGKVVSTRYENDEPKVIADIQGTAQTIYMGDLKKRGKKGVFRAYNKGLEQGLDTPLTRFELEIRGGSATVAIQRLLKGLSISMLVRAVVDIPGAEWWESIFDAPPETLPRTFGEDELDMAGARWHWLCRQVAPALGKLMAIERKERTQNFAKFMDAVNAAERKAFQFDGSE